MYSRKIISKRLYGTFTKAQNISKKSVEHNNNKRYENAGLIGIFSQSIIKTLIKP